MRKTSVNYLVEITYKAKFYPKYDVTIHKLLGDWHGSGMGSQEGGAGERDICWIFMQDKAAAEKFLEKAKSKLRGLKLSIDLVKYNSII